MAQDWTADAISDAFTAAALGADSWQNALDIVSRETGSFGGTLIPLRGEIPELPTSRSFQEAIDAYFRDGWVERDTRFLGADMLMRTGVTTDLDFLTPERMAKDPYYQEWLRPFGLKWFAALRVDGFDDTWALSLQRTETQLPFDAEERLKLQRVSRVMSDAARLANALGLARIDASLQAFEVSGKAVVMLSRRGDVIRVNKAADACFDDDLFVQSKRLISSNPEAMKALERAIHLASSTLAHPGPIEPVRLPRRDRQSVIAHVLQARGAVLDVFSPCHVFVVLVDLALRRPLPPPALQKLFGLTKAEAKLAYRLACGDKLQDISLQLGISYETARSHTRSILSKVGVGSQADLIANLVRLDVSAS